MQKMLSYLAGVVTGALVGATLVVLFTPVSGETLRSDLRNRVTGAREQISSAMAARREELEGQLARLREPRSG